MKLLLYAASYSARLNYISQFIFKELMCLDCSITQDIEAFEQYEGVKINYSHRNFTTQAFIISPVSLLFQSTIQQQDIECGTINNYIAFFKINNSDFPFDILAASFYLLSRYEEYLPHQKDMYGRFAHQNALAFKEGFLQVPLVNIWVAEFKFALKNKFATLKITEPLFNFLPTYDIDIAFSYRHKGFIRNIGGFLKNPSLQRIKVLCGLEKDPFDVYKNLDNLHRRYKLSPIYFFLIAAQNSVYDKNISVEKREMTGLIKSHASKYAIGIHPSWQSGDNPSLLKKEINKLEKLVEYPINSSRQHYIRFNLPEGYSRLIANKITADYSMGYGSINGFRASVASSFFWYDFSAEQQTTLRIHPFCFMDANSFYEQHYSSNEAFFELINYYTICKKVGGTLTTVFHNNFLGTDPLYKDWAEMYTNFLENIIE